MKSRIKIAVSSSSFSKNDVLINELSKISDQLELNTLGRNFDEESLAQFLSKAACECAIIGTEPVSRLVLERCKKLRFIAKYGVGTDNIDMEALDKAKVKIGWSPGVNKRSVSELTLGFMLGHFRNINNSINKMKSGVWQKDGGRLLSSKTVGIVGFGNIGTDLALLLRPFEVSIKYFDILDRTEIGRDLEAEFLPYEQLLQCSDVVTFHVPATPLTKGMYAPRQIVQTSSDALIINTSRGSVVDFERVCDAVREKRLGGFASDVFPYEPFSSVRYNDNLNLYFTPHIGGSAYESVISMGMTSISHLRQYLGLIDG